VKNSLIGGFCKGGFSMKTRTTSYLETRIDAMQQELEQLRKMLIYQLEDSKRKTQLKGLWKGIEVTEEEIEEAERAVFKHAYF
jgi:hypothetical protein